MRTQAMAMNPKRNSFDVIGSGYVRCNKKRWKDAKLVLFRPGYGIVSLEFMELGVGERRDERDENGNLINCKVHVTEYGPKIGEIGTDFANGESYRGIIFYESGRFDFGFSKKTWNSGDIREIAPAALKEAGWPIYPKDSYYLIAKSGEFWDRPYPKGYKRKET